MVLVVVCCSVYVRMYVCSFSTYLTMLCNLYVWLCALITPCPHAGVHKGEDVPVLRRRSIDMPSLTPMAGDENQYSVNISLVNLEFNCTVAAEDETGVRTSEHSPAQRVEPLITSPPSKWV